jgi:hypothetical protein
VAVQAFSYQLTKAEWMMIALIWVKKRPLTLLRLGFLGLMALMFLALDVSIFTQSLRSKTFSASTVSSILFFLFFGLAIASLHFWRFRKEVNNAMQPDWDSEVTLTIEPSGLLISRTGVNENRYFWSSIQRVVETERFGLIYLTKRDCIAFPKRVLPDGVFASLNAYIRQGGEAS